MRCNYVNLTDGLEWCAELKDYSFCRIESTAIEKGDWDRVILDLDADLLMRLALGCTCVVYDCGTRRETSKTVSLGVPKIKSILETAWLTDAPWEARTDKARAAKRKLKYYKRYVDAQVVRLEGVSRSTTRDGDKAFYRELTLIEVKRWTDA